MAWDVFISHASEDKESFVRALAEALQRRGVSVWYDEFALTAGDSLRESIQRGLRESRFGVVVLSCHFFAKEWPKRELNALTARQTKGEGKVIIPVWHDVSVEEVEAFDLALADLVGIPTNRGLEAVVDELLRGMGITPAVSGEGLSSEADKLPAGLKIRDGTILSETDDAEMVLIPAGEFQMGSNDGRDNEKPVHPVSLDAFYMDVYEVTNAQYATFLTAMGKHQDGGVEWLDIDAAGVLIERVDGRYRPKAGYDNHPVIAVSWYGAAAYAQWEGKRLPTEAEWEYAARGGLAGKQYPWGDGISHDDANYSGTGGRDQWSGTSPVGSFPPNGYGLYDMAGNVWEWCMDEWDSGFYAQSPRNNPIAGGLISFVNNIFTNVNTSRVLRGGSRNNAPSSLRVANRGSCNPTDAGSYDGFRCAGFVTP